MKPAAAILAIIWTLAMVQPSFAYFGGKSAYGKCSKAVPAKSGCTKKKSAGYSCNKKKLTDPSPEKKKCNKPCNSPGKDNCKADGCNPTLGCASGNFYIHHHYQVPLHTWFSQKQKILAYNDNRIIENLSECFHPPEA